MEKPVGSIHAQHTKLSSDDRALTLFRKSNLKKNQKERALILQVNAAAACARCMWELRSVMSHPLNDALMSPCPELLFTGCPLPICQSELVSTVIAHGNERHLSLWYLMRDWGETWHNAAREHLMTVELSVLYSSVEYLTTVPSVAHYTPLFFINSKYS